jgi:histidinol dehydrogenase
VLVIADDSADPSAVAADLLSQAEHGPDSQVLLVTPSRGLADTVAEEVDFQLASLPRRDIAAQAIANSRMLVVDSLEQALVVSNSYGPEHLILAVDDARRWTGSIRVAGSVFLGHYAPESLGDYCSGTNHVLPTYGYAKAWSGLGLADFQRRISVQEVTLQGLEELGPTAVTLARLEGLEAHARAVIVRIGEGDAES